MDFLGIGIYCNSTSGTDKDDPTCLAVRAMWDTTAALAQAFPRGPAFQKYQMVKLSPCRHLMKKTHRLY